MLPSRWLALVVCLVSLGLFTTTPAHADDPKFTWTDDPDHGTCELTLGDQPVLLYMYAYDPSTEETLHNTYKVYHHVFAPGTGTRLTKGPGGQYTHHRGLYVAWNKTGYEGTSADFWHCTKGAHQRHVKFHDKTVTAEHAAMTSEIHWNDADGKPVIVELRTLEVRRLPWPSADQPGWQINWRSQLESRRGTITLDGDRQHAGFQFRADQPVADAASARYIRPAGFPDQPAAFEVDDRTAPDGHINLNWLAMSYPLANDKGVVEKYTVQYCEDPALPKPSRYSERPYGRFGAFFKTTLEADKPLTLRYQLNITRGDSPAPETLQAWYKEFTQSLQPAK
jgi:hypothetical protein